jgi:hypothetical protein
MGAPQRYDSLWERRQSAAGAAALGWDDPVPSATDEESAWPVPRASDHRLECEVQRRLLEEPGMNFTSLVVRRIHDGVCIQGVLESDLPFNLIKLAREVEGVNRVIDLVVVYHPEPTLAVD